MSKKSESKMIRSNRKSTKRNAETSAGSHTTRVHATKSDNIIVWRFIVTIF